MLEFFGLATQMRRQGFPVVLGKNPWRVAVDELVQIGRVSADGDRSHPQVTTALREQFEGFCGGPGQDFCQGNPFAISHIGYYLLYIVDATIKFIFNVLYENPDGPVPGAGLKSFSGARASRRLSSGGKQSATRLYCWICAAALAQAGDGRPDSGLHRSLRAGSAGTGFRSQEADIGFFLNGG